MTKRTSTVEAAKAVLTMLAFISEGKVFGDRPKLAKAVNKAAKMDLNETNFKTIFDAFYTAAAVVRFPVKPLVKNQVVDDARALRERIAQLEAENEKLKSASAGGQWLPYRCEKKAANGDAIL